MAFFKDPNPKLQLGFFQTIDTFVAENMGSDKVLRRVTEAPA